MNSAEFSDYTQKRIELRELRVAVGAVKKE